MIKSDSSLVSKLHQDVSLGREEVEVNYSNASVRFMKNYEEARRILKSKFSEELLSAFNVVEYPKLDFAFTRSLRTGKFYFASLNLHWSEIRRGGRLIVKTPESEVLAALNAQYKEIADLMNVYFEAEELETIGPLVQYSNVNAKLFRSRRRGDDYFQTLSSNWDKIARSSEPTIEADSDDSSKFFDSFGENYLFPKIQTNEMVFSIESYQMIPDYTPEERDGIDIKKEKSRKYMKTVHRKILKKLIQDNPKPNCKYDFAVSRYEEFLASIASSEKLLEELAASGRLKIVHFINLIIVYCFRSSEIEIERYKNCDC